MARDVDKYANIASATLTLSAANTLSFQELLTGISLGRNMGILIDSISYTIGIGSIAEMTTATDYIDIGWSTSSAFTGVSLADSRIIHTSELVRIDNGTAASGHLFQQPVDYDFLPPIIVASPRIYLFANSNGLAGAATVTSRMRFRYVNLTDKEYIELAEAFVLVG